MSSPHPPTRMTFFRRLLPLVTSGRKTITIRDHTESDYQPGSVVQVFPLDATPDEPAACTLRIISVTPLQWDEINETHAEQEGFDLEELKQFLREIYPTAEQLYCTTFRLETETTNLSP